MVAPALEAHPSLPPTEAAPSSQPHSFTQGLRQAAELARKPVDFLSGVVTSASHATGEAIVATGSFLEVERAWRHTGRRLTAQIEAKLLGGETTGTIYLRRFAQEFTNLSDEEISAKITAYLTQAPTKDSGLDPQVQTIVRKLLTDPSAAIDLIKIDHRSPSPSFSANQLLDKLNSQKAAVRQAKSPLPKIRHQGREALADLALTPQEQIQLVNLLSYHHDHKATPLIFGGITKEKAVQAASTGMALGLLVQGLPMLLGKATNINTLYGIARSVSTLTSADRRAALTRQLRAIFHQDQGWKETAAIIGATAAVHVLGNLVKFRQVSSSSLILSNAAGSGVKDLVPEEVRRRPGSHFARWLDAYLTGSGLYYLVNAGIGVGKTGLRVIPTTVAALESNPAVRAALSSLQESHPTVAKTDTGLAFKDQGKTFYLDQKTNPNTTTTTTSLVGSDGQLTPVLEVSTDSTANPKMPGRAKLLFTDYPDVNGDSQADVVHTVVTGEVHSDQNTYPNVATAVGVDAAYDAAATHVVNLWQALPRALPPDRESLTIAGIPVTNTELSLMHQAADYLNSVDLASSIDWSHDPQSQIAAQLMAAKDEDNNLLFTRHQAQSLAQRFAATTQNPATYGLFRDSLDLRQAANDDGDVATISSNFDSLPSESQFRQAILEALAGGTATAPAPVSLPQAYHDNAADTLALWRNLPGDVNADPFTDGVLNLAGFTITESTPELLYQAASYLDSHQDDIDWNQAPEDIQTQIKTLLSQDVDQRFDAQEAEFISQALVLSAQNPNTYAAFERAFQDALTDPAQVPDATELRQRLVTALSGPVQATASAAATPPPQPSTEGTPSTPDTGGEPPPPEAAASAELPPLLTLSNTARSSIGQWFYADAAPLPQDLVLQPIPSTSTSGHQLARLANSEGQLHTPPNLPGLPDTLPFVIVNDATGEGSIGSLELIVGSDELPFVASPIVIDLGDNLAAALAAAHQFEADVRDPSTPAETDKLHLLTSVGATQIDWVQVNSSLRGALFLHGVALQDGHLTTTSPLESAVVNSQDDINVISLLDSDIDTVVATFLPGDQDKLDFSHLTNIHTLELDSSSLTDDHLFRSLPAVDRLILPLHPSADLSQVVGQVGTLEISRFEGMPTPDQVNDLLTLGTGRADLVVQADALTDHSLNDLLNATANPDPQSTEHLLLVFEGLPRTAITDTPITTDAVVVFSGPTREAAEQTLTAVLATEEGQFLLSQGVRFAYLNPDNNNIVTPPPAPEETAPSGPLSWLSTLIQGLIPPSQPSPPPPPAAPIELAPAPTPTPTPEATPTVAAPTPTASPPSISQSTPSTVAIMIATGVAGLTALGLFAYSIISDLSGKNRSRS